jgi:hypothetical protein
MTSLLFQHLLFFLLFRGIDAKLQGRNQVSAQVDAVRSMSEASSQDGVTCLFLIGRQIGFTEDGRHEHFHKDYRCQTFASEGNLPMKYDIPDSVLKQLTLHELKSGKSILHIKGASAVHDHTNGYYLDVGPDASVEVSEHSERRLLSRTQGTSSVLVVLVRSSDSVNSLTHEFVSKQIFSRDIVSFASQYDKCSGGKLQYVPAGGERITNGVTDLFIKQAVLGGTMSITIENMLLESLVAAFGTPDVADHVLFCMPAGMRDSWIGYTYGEGTLSYFNDEWCGYYSLPFHEVRVMIEW